MINKSTLRKNILKARNSLDATCQQDNSRTICNLIANHIQQNNLKSVALYLAFKSEVDLSSLIASCPHTDFYAPICLPNFQMTWAQVDDINSLTKNHYGILEPNIEHANDSVEFDMILMPLAAYDKQGNRLGMGAGFYDRYLATLAKAPLLIGCAHSIQEVDLVPTDEWDQPMNAIATENGISWTQP